MDYQNLIIKIENHEPFSFSRWGDGEWSAILRKNGENCDGHTYFSDLGEALANVLQEPYDNHFYGMQNLALRQMGNEINAFLKKEKIKILWVNSDILHNASMNGKLEDFFLALSKRNIHIVGNLNIIKLKRPFRFDMLFIPEKNAWLHYEEVMKILRENARRMNDTVFLFAAGMMSAVMIHELERINSFNTYIDVGSVLDPYMGIQSRNYHKKLKV